MLGRQKTIRDKVKCVGVGLHTGKKVSITLIPAQEDSGVVFRRVDITNKDQFILASWANVSNTVLGTTLTNSAGVSVATIEHLMAAFWGCGIDNCVVEIDGPEVPIMDGSSEPFIFLIECAGSKQQNKGRRIIEVLKEVSVSEENNGKNPAHVSIMPAEDFSVSLEIDFDNKVISKQKCVFDSKDFSFKNDLSRARTFGFAHEVEYLRAQGLARGGSLDNAIVIDNNGVMNEDGLRYSDEFVRHKILDCIGDVYLAGGYIKGQLRGFKSGHALNNQLLRKFFADKDAWRILQIDEIKEQLARQVISG